MNETKLKKVDAPKNRNIHVMLGDFEHSVCRDHQKCVIARAIKRATNAEWVDVANSTVLIKRKGTKRLTRFLLDVVAREQVAFFDKKHQFAPCVVVLKAPIGTQKLTFRPRHDEVKPHSGPPKNGRKQPTR